MKPQIVAHRGSSELHAENSWAAFEAAVAEGADAIECDIQGTGDGELVIRHDLNIGNRLVADCSAAQIDALQPGLVRLADLLAWAPRVGVGLLKRCPLLWAISKAFLIVAHKEKVRS